MQRHRTYPRGCTTGLAPCAAGTSATATRSIRPQRSLGTGERAASLCGVRPGVGLRSALGWGRWASRRQAWAEAVEAFDFATAAADALVRRQLTRQDKEVWLQAVATMPALAAVALIRNGAPE